MRLDPGTNYTIDESHAAKEYSVTTHEGVTVDHKGGDCVSFFISAGTIGSSSTIDVKVQYSDNDSDWTDEPNTDAGNDTSITQIVAAGDARLDVPNPRGRYSRVHLTVGVTASSLGIVSILGPLRYVAP